MSVNDPFDREMLEMITDVLALDAGEVTPDKTWFHDLDAESIDLLELSFRSSKQFGVNVPLQKMMDQKLLETDEQGVLTPRGLDALRTQFPYLDLTEFSRDPRLTRIGEILTVRAIIEFVRKCVAEGSPAGTPSTAN